MNELTGTRRVGGRKQTKITKSFASQPEEEKEDTIYVQLPRGSFKTEQPLAANVASRQYDQAPSSSTGGMEDISLTSPTPSNVTADNAENVPIQSRELGSQASSNLSSAMETVVSQPSISAGSAYHPIEIGESPPRHQSNVTKKPEKASSPHKFHKSQKRQRKLYTWLPDRPPLAPKPASGNTFTGDRSHDIYRMMNAKTVANGSKIPPAPPHTAFRANDFSVPFEVRYPKSAQFLAQQRTANQYPTKSAETTLSSYAQHHNRMGVSLNGETENMLRKKALQHVRSHSKSQALSNKNANLQGSTNNLANSRMTLGSLPTPPSSTLPPLQRKLQVYADPPKPASSSSLSHLVSQNAHLNRLLQSYPASQNQQAVRTQISHFVSQQTSSLNTWLEHENLSSQNKRRRSNTDSTISVGSESVGVGESESNGTGCAMEKPEKKDEQAKAGDRDEEIRLLLSSSAAIWQGGGGIGVADVQAVDGTDCEGEEMEETE